MVLSVQNQDRRRQPIRLKERRNNFSQRIS
jgi:hypothetical protein